VFDTGNSSDSFFYTWSELTSALDWFQFGVVIPRTKVYQPISTFIAVRR